MRPVCAILVFLLASLNAADDNRSLGDRTEQYLGDLLRLDTSNPPGNESRVAEYLKKVADANGIPAELLGNDPRRLNFVARLRGTGKGRPLLLMAHSDVVPVDRAQWSVDPFSGEVHNGSLYGRGAQDDKSLLAAELAVMVEIKRRNIHLNRDLILLSESDEEAGSSGIQWMVQNQWPKIDAEFALNEGGYILESKEGPRLFQVQTVEKIPTRMTLTARGTAGHGSLPRSDNPVLHLSRAIVKISEADQPVRMNSTTRRYFREIGKLPEYSWLPPLLPRLENPGLATAAANQIRNRDLELDAMLRTTITATMLRAGVRVNVIPNVAEAQVDVRRLPNETREDILNRLRQIVNDNAVDVELSPSQFPVVEPSPTTTALYRSLERVLDRIYPHDSAIPFMSRTASDGTYLRARGMAVYGVPIFVSEGREGREHGNNERISPKNVDAGVELLWQIVLETAVPN